MSKFITANPGGGIDPIHLLKTGKFRPVTPAYYDPDSLGMDAFPIGLGTRIQAPTDSKQTVVDAGWRWLGARAGVGLLVTPISISGSLGLPPTADTTPSAPFIVDLGFDIGPQSTPAPPGPHGTANIAYTILGFHDFYDQPIPQFWQIGEFTPSAATGGLDSLFVSFIVTATLGKYTIQTKDQNVLGEPHSEPGRILYWNDNVELSWRCRYFHSGAGFAPDYPPTPMEPCDGPFSTESADNINAVEEGTTFFNPFAPYYNEYDVGIDDGISGVHQTPSPKLRTFTPFGDHASTAVPTGSLGISVTSYKAKRDGL